MPRGGGRITGRLQGEVGKQKGGLTFHTLLGVWGSKGSWLYPINMPVVSVKRLYLVEQQPRVLELS